MEFTPVDGPPVGPPLAQPNQTPPNLSLGPDAIRSIQPNNINLQSPVTSPPLMPQMTPGANQLPPPGIATGNQLPPPGPPLIPQPNQLPQPTPVDEQIAALESQLSKAQRREARYERRMDRASTTMERMDHKDALYSDLGQVALGTVTDHWLKEEVIYGYDHVDQKGRIVKEIRGDDVPPIWGLPAPTGHTMIPRSRQEYVYIDSHGNRVTEEHIDKQRVPLAQNTPTGEPARTRSAAERHIDRKIDKRSLKADKAGIYSGRRERLYRETNDTRRHSSPWERLKNKVKSSWATHKNEKTASQNRADKAEIGATRNVYEKKTQLKKQRLTNRKDRKVHRAVEQPVLSRWRSMRRKNAIGRVKNNHRKAEQQRDLIEDLNNQINNLQNTP